MENSFEKYLKLSLYSSEVFLMDEEIKEICLKLFKQWEQLINSNPSDAYKCKKMLDEIIKSSIKGLKILKKEQDKL